MASGAGGSNFLKRVAIAVRKEVGAWTGLVWCNSNSVWGTGDFVVVKPGGRLEPVEAPSVYEGSKNMDTLKLQSAEGYEDIGLGAVKSVSYMPIGSLPEQISGVSLSGQGATSLLQHIDLANPFVTEDKPGAILVGQLTVTYENQSKEKQIRAFRLLAYSLLEDTLFPNTYYYVSKELRSALQRAK